MLQKVNHVVGGAESPESAINHVVGGAACKVM